MNSKRMVLGIMFSLYLFLIGVLPAVAVGKEIPDVDGDYPDPVNVNQRVRVFVHKVKSSSQAVLACVDPDSSALVSPTGWKLPSSVVYRLNPSSVPSSVGSSNLGVIAEKSFKSWSDGVGGKILFTPGAITKTNKQAGDGQNVIAWGRTSGSALAVTYTRYNSTTKQVVDVDTIMNLKFPWKWTDSSLSCSDPSYYDAQNILTHELGHWMGLDDHYTASYVDNTMYGYGSKGETKKDSLSTGDMAGASAIYQ